MGGETERESEKLREKSVMLLVRTLFNTNTKIARLRPHDRSVLSTTLREGAVIEYLNY